jgi:Dolichyl-phosphate-mannose-protein mannosyltransferase
MTGAPAAAFPGSPERARERRPLAARPAAWPATAALACVALALFLAFVGYGFNLEDEGTILYQILRAYRGERPYLDFHTGYTPAMFYVNAGLFSLFGVSALPVRILLALVNALAVALIFRLALRFAPPLEAACAGLAYALCMPFFAGQFAAFNIPYPAWYAVAAWLAAELASLRAAGAGGRGWLFVAGLASGIAFSFKPNTGVLCLGAAVLARLLASAPAAGRLGAALESGLLAVACVAVAAVLGFEVATVKFALLALPAVALVSSAIPVRARRRRSAAAGATRPLGAAMGDLVAIAGGFLAVTWAWLAYFLWHLGADGFGREILLLGAGVERIYGLIYPEPTLWSALAVGLLLATAFLPLAIERGWLARRGLIALGVAALAGVVASVSTFALAPEGLVISTAMQLENLSFFVLPAILAGAVALWLRGRRQPRPTVALVYALLLFIQVYPRIDFMHVVISMPSALVVAAGLLVGVERRWVAALGFAADEPARARAMVWVRVAAVVPIALALLARAAPLAEARLRWDEGPAWRPMTALGAEALPVAIERDRDHDLRELRRVAALVESATGPDDQLLVFPALGVVPFMTDRRTPVPHDYFYAGRPSHADEARMLGQIEAARPPLAITLNDRLGYFSASPAYYFLLRDYVQRNYALARRIGRFDVFLRRDLVRAAREPSGPHRAGGPLSVAFAHGEYRREVRRARALARDGDVADLSGSMARLADPDRQVRRLRLLAIAAVARRTAGGLAAVEETVAPDRRSRLLLARALGEFGSADALPYLRDVYMRAGGSGSRLGREASTAINYILARELASRYGWAGAEEAPLWSVPGELLDDDLVRELPEFEPRQRIGALTALAAAAAGRDDLAGAIEPVQHPRDTSWWRVVAAYSLVKLGRTEYLRAMVEQMEDGTLAEQYVPSLLLDPAVVDPTLTAELVRDLLRSGAPGEREVAAWMSPLLGGLADRDALSAAIRDPDPRVREAARWALAHLDRAAPSAGEARGEGVSAGRDRGARTAP